MWLTDANLVFLDIETTGLSPAMGDRIVEIGMIMCQPNRKAQRASQLINPQRPIPVDAQRIHGIRDEDVADSPTFDAVAGRVCSALRESWIIGHNTRFDVGFLAMEMALAGRSGEPAGCLDTCQLTGAIWDLPNYQLDTVAASLGMPRSEVHRAFGDALAAKTIFDRIVEELGGPTKVSLSDLQALHKYVPVWPVDPRRSLPGPLYDALTSGRPISIRYVNGDGVASLREIRPFACFPAGRHLYIRADCRQAGELRTFRLDRIVEVSR
jgi:DNA polymerase III epsilon subunit-like protein